MLLSLRRGMLGCWHAFLLCTLMVSGLMRVLAQVTLKLRRPGMDVSVTLVEAAADLPDMHWLGTHGQQHVGNQDGRSEDMSGGAHGARDRNTFKLQEPDQA